jgi:hypothetical protein
MSFVLDLSKSVKENTELLEDLCRFSEGLYEEKFIRRKYRAILDTDDWIHLASDDSLIEMIETRKLQRVRDGSFKREKAQQLIVKGPEILDGIATNPKANDKHKIDALKALDDLADPGPSRFAEDQDRIVIKIDLGADVRAKRSGKQPGRRLGIRRANPAQPARRSHRQHARSPIPPQQHQRRPATCTTRARTAEGIEEQAKSRRYRRAPVRPREQR